MTSATKRFAATLGELTGGRVGLTCASGERRVTWRVGACLVGGLGCLGLGASKPLCDLHILLLYGQAGSLQVLLTFIPRLPVRPPSLLQWAC
jgi:hypothetical protein